MKILETNWEQYFIQESQLLEDKLARGEIAPSASRLKLALENNILEWSTYSLWAQQNYLLPVLKRGLYKDQVIALQKNISTKKQEFNKYDLQKFHMIALDLWENKLIILGLEPAEALNSLGIEYILVLTPPEIITTLAGEVLSETPLMAIPGAVPAPPTAPKKPSATDATELFDLADDLKAMADEGSDNDEGSENEESEEKLTPIDLPKFDDHAEGQTNVNFNELLVSIPGHNQAKPEGTSNKQSLQASSPSKETQKTSGSESVQSQPTTEQKITDSSQPDPNDQFVNSIDTIQYWNKINQDHNSLSADARKNFDGYAVLKINNLKTELFRLDEELQNEKLEPALFQFDLNEDFFAKLLKNKSTDSVSLKMLNRSILDFNYVCATPLFLGNKAVGFILGFKISAMNEQDEDVLQRLTKSA